MANYIINPIVQFCFQIYTIPVGAIAGNFGTPYGELVFKCWGYVLHFGDPLEEIILLFITDQIQFQI